MAAAVAATTAAAHLQALLAPVRVVLAPHLAVALVPAAVVSQVAPLAVQAVAPVAAPAVLAAHKVPLPC